MTGYESPPAPDASSPGVPAPPAGPGVTPPFNVPPTDRNRRGLWIGLGVGALTALLCCVGGIVGFVLLTVAGSRQIEREAVVVVNEYLGALQERDYDAAYDLLCPEVTRDLTAEAFAERQRRQSEISSFQVGRTQVGNAIVVPAQVSYVGGSTESRRFQLSQEFGQDLLICGGIS